MNIFFAMSILTFSLMVLIQFLRLFEIENYLSSILGRVFFVLWIIFTILGLISNKKSDEGNRIRDEDNRIESLSSSMNHKTDNIKELALIYNATSFEEHKNHIVSKLDTISRHNHGNLYNINSKSKCEIEEYRSSNEHLLSHTCELFENFWTGDPNKGITSLENFFQVHSFLNYFSDEKYNYFEHEKLLKSCGCPGK